MFEIFLNEIRKCEIAYGNISENDRDHARAVKEKRYIRGQKRRTSNVNVEEQVPTVNSSPRGRGTSVRLPRKEDSAIVF